MPRQSRLLEWVCVSVIFVIVASWVWGACERSRERSWFQRRIDSLAETTTLPAPLPGNRSILAGNLAGRWVMRRRRHTSRLTFNRLEDCDNTHYQVEFATYCSARRYDATRTAEFCDGIVHLDKPVAGSDGMAYRELQCVSIGKQMALIPVSESVDTALLIESIRMAEDDGEWSPLRSLIYLRDGQ